MSSPPLDYAKLAGPVFIGQVLHWGLFGALSVQVYIYHLAFSKDPPTRKLLVYGIYAAELAQTILFAKAGFSQFAAGFGNFEALNNIGLLWFAVPILSSCVEFVVQLFYAYRIKLLARSNVIPMVVVLFSLVQLGGAIGQGVIGRQIPDFSVFKSDRKTLIVTGIWNATSAVCDIIIAVSMTYYLSRWRTDYKATQQIVHRLIRLIIETGTLTATIAIINLALFLLPDHPIYWQATIGILGTLYANMMMMVLNNRIVFKTQDDTITSSNDFPLSPQGTSSRRLHGGISVTHEEWKVPLEV